MMTDPSPDVFIARILGPDGRPVGVGALVSEAARGDLRARGERGARTGPQAAKIAGRTGDAGLPAGPGAGARPLTATVDAVAAAAT